MEGVVLGEAVFGVGEFPVLGRQTALARSVLAEAGKLVDLVALVVLAEIGEGLVEESLEVFERDGDQNQGLHDSQESCVVVGVEAAGGNGTQRLGIAGCVVRSFLNQELAGPGLLGQQTHLFQPVAVVVLLEQEAVFGQKLLVETPQPFVEQVLLGQDVAGVQSVPYQVVSQSGFWDCAEEGAGAFAGVGFGRTAGGVALGTGDAAALLEDFDDVAQLDV
jgi:hypothetical protein